MSIFDDDDYDELLWSNFLKNNDNGKKRPSKVRQRMERSVKYAGPGHTIVTYPNRKLDIRFPETEKQFEARKKARRRKAGRKGGSAPKGIRPQYLYEDGELTYGQKRTRDKYSSYRISKGLASDEYNTDDMRALLKDAHWEEVCGHSRWKYDNKSLVREFGKYQKKYGGM